MSRRRRILRWALWVLVVIALVDLSRRLVLSRSLYDLNLAVGAHLDPLPSPREGDRLVIFAPHPDDETLGTGGLIQQAVAAGAHVAVVVLTNGEFSEYSVILSEKTMRRSPQQFIRLGYARQQETLAALRYQGLAPSHVTFLGYPNGYLDQMWSPAHWSRSRPVTSARTRTAFSPYDNSLTPRAVYCGEALLEDIRRVLVREQPTRVVALHPNDVHLDHWPTGAFVSQALEELSLAGHAFARTCPVHSYLIHRNHWPVPRGYEPWLTMEPPAALMGGETTWFALPLTMAQTIDKHTATREYKSQGGGIDPLLESFSRATELYGVMRVRTWRDARTVAPTVVATDPPRDVDTAAARPFADITEVRLSRDDQGLVVELVLRDVPSPRTGYHLSLRGGSARPADRVLVELNWRGGRADGIVLRDGALRRVPGDLLGVSQSGRVTRLRAPWPFRAGAPGYMMVRAWTTGGRRILDRTGLSLLRVMAASPAAGPPAGDSRSAASAQRKGSMP